MNSIEPEEFKRMEEWKAYNDFTLQSMEWTIGFANITIRALLLANGGALVALLTFFGTTWVATKSVIPQALTSLEAFLAGLFCAILVGGLSYLAQLCFSHRNDKPGTFFQFSAILVAVISLAAFACGAWHIIGVFKSA